jgi:hypothetical protein
MDGIMNTYVHRYMKGYVSSLVTIGSPLLQGEKGDGVDGVREQGDGVRSLIEHNWVRRRHLL